VEEFAIEDFDKGFFENYVLIRAMFSHNSVMDGNFYTVYVQDGKLNFIFEATDVVGEMTIGGLVAYVILHRIIFERYEIGTVEWFYIYDCQHDFVYGCVLYNMPQNKHCRENLQEIHANSVENKVADIIPYLLLTASWLGDNNLITSEVGTFGASLVAITSYNQLMLATGLRHFPSVVEEFAIEDFDKDFFENYVLIRVMLSIGSIIYGNFYTVYVQDGKLNFLFEVTELTGATALGGLVAYIIIPRRIFERYEIGTVEWFFIYNCQHESGHGCELYNMPIRKTSREELHTIYTNSVENKIADIIPYLHLSSSWLSQNNLIKSPDGFLIVAASLIAITSFNELMLALA